MGKRTAKEVKPPSMGQLEQSMSRTSVTAVAPDKVATRKDVLKKSKKKKKSAKRARLLVGLQQLTAPKETFKGILAAEYTLIVSPGGAGTEVRKRKNQKDSRRQGGADETDGSSRGQEQGKALDDRGGGKNDDGGDDCEEEEEVRSVRVDLTNMTVLDTAAKSGFGSQTKLSNDDTAALEAAATEIDPTIEAIALSAVDTVAQAVAPLRCQLIFDVTSEFGSRNVTTDSVTAPSALLMALVGDDGVVVAKGSANVHFSSGGSDSGGDEGGLRRVTVELVGTGARRLLLRCRVFATVTVVASAVPDVTERKASRRDMKRGANKFNIDVKAAQWAHDDLHGLAQMSARGSSKIIDTARNRPTDLLELSDDEGPSSISSNNNNNSSSKSNKNKKNDKKKNKGI